MSVTVPITCVFLWFGMMAASGAQTAKAGEPPRLIIESMTGGDSFRFYCAPCHGVTGRGDGPVAAALRTRPADLTTLKKLNVGTFPRSAVTASVIGTGRASPSHGPSDMPVWGPIFRALDPSDVRVKIRIENIVDYIESLQRDAP